MTDRIQPYRERCKCGHDRASHFEENGKRLTCLVFGDCGCKRYVNEFDKSPEVLPIDRYPTVCAPKRFDFLTGRWVDDDDPPPSTDPFYRPGGLWP